MGVGAGIDDNGVVHPVGGVNLVDNVPLVVGLEAVRGGIMGGGVVPDEGAQGLVALLAVDARLPPAQQVQVGAVDDEEFHASDTSM